MGNIVTVLKWFSILEFIVNDFFFIFEGTAATP